MTDTLTDAQLARARAQTHERINDLIVKPPPRRSRKLPVLAVAAVAAAAVAVVATPGSQPEPATAATILRALDPQQLPVLGPGEYYAVRIVHHGPQTMDSRRWTDAAGNGRELALFDGVVKRDAPVGTSSDVASVPPPEPAPRFRNLPDTLQAFMSGVRGEPTASDYLMAAAQMVFDPSGTPPATLHEVFAFLAGLDGIELVGNVTDALGRTGTAVGIGPLQLIVDNETGRPLALKHERGEATRQEGVVKDTQTLPG